MSEEEVKENVEETPEVAEEEDSSNPIFNALFKAVENDEPEEEQEEFVPPSSLQSALHDIEQGDTGEAEEKKEEQVEQPAAEEEVKEAPKKRVARKKKIIDPDFKPEVKKTLPPSPPKPQSDLSGLNPHEKSRYELAQWASQNMKGYQGKDTQYLQFFKDHKKYLDKRLQEDPDVDLNEDQDYLRFLQQNRPDFNVELVKEAKTLKIAEENALKKLTPEIEKQQKELKRIKAEPAAKKAIASTQGLIAKSVPSEIMTEFRNNPNFTKTHALEAKIVDRVLGDANAMAEAFHQIAGDLVDFDEKNPVHARLSQWIDKEQNAFIQTGKTKKNGKVFVRRERFPHIPANERQNYYTFSDNDLMKILAKRAGDSMKAQIDKSLKDLEASGFVRNGQPAPKAQQPVVQQPTQRMNPSPRPGPSVDSKQSDPNENKVLSLLGL